MNMIQRPRRLRISSGMRDLVRETELSVRDFVYPIFVVPGEKIKEEIPSMPGCFHYSVDQVAALAYEIAARGIRAVEVFGQQGGAVQYGGRADRDDGRGLFGGRGLGRRRLRLTLTADEEQGGRRERDDRWTKHHDRFGHGTSLSHDPL